MNIQDLWRVLGRDLDTGGMVVGTIVKPKLGLRSRLFADACYQFWLGGDFVKNDEPQGNQVYAPMRETTPLVADAMKRAMDDTGQAKIFSANITADDPFEMIARGEYILETFGEHCENVAFLVDGFVGGPGMVTLARRHFPNQFLHYHRAGHGAVTSVESNRGYTSLVHMKWSRMLGASGIHVGTMGYGKMEGYAGDKVNAFMLTDDSVDGTFFHQEWERMKSTTPIISGGGALGHKDGIVAGAKSLRQAFTAWQEGVDLIDYAKEHEELHGAFETFQEDADNLYPAWREKLGTHR